MAGKKPPIRKPAVPANSVADATNKQESTNPEGLKMGQMGIYTRYSYFMEEKLGLGRNGKRLAHGGVVAGGVFAAGRYGGVEIINQNMPAALAAGAATGFLGTVAADMLFIDAEQEALMRRQAILDSSPEVQKRLLADADALVAEMSRKVG